LVVPNSIAGISTFYAVVKLKNDESDNSCLEGVLIFNFIYPGNTNWALKMYGIAV